MRKTLLLCVLYACTLPVFSQEQPFKQGFYFYRKTIEAHRDSLFVIHNQSSSVLQEVGYLERTRERILKQSDSAYALYLPRRIYGQKKYLKGVIKERNEDSLFIQFFPFKNDLLRDSTGLVNSTEQDSLFVLKLQWSTSSRGNRFRDIPYRNIQIAAANFPLKINFSDGKVETSFFNVAISVTKIFGKARIYETDFLEPRYRYFGIGPVFGFGTRQNKNEAEEFSLSYGISTIGSIYGIKLLAGFGIENGFTRNSKKPNLFLGIGFGLDIYSLVDPEIKKKE